MVLPLKLYSTAVGARERAFELRWDKEWGRKLLPPSPLAFIDVTRALWRAVNHRRAADHRKANAYLLVRPYLPSALSMRAKMASQFWRPYSSIGMTSMGGIAELGLELIGLIADLGAEQDDIPALTVLDLVEAARGDFELDAVLVGILRHLLHQHARRHAASAHKQNPHSDPLPYRFPSRQPLATAQRMPARLFFDSALASGTISEAIGKWRLFTGKAYLNACLKTYVLAYSQAAASLRRRSDTRS